VRSGRGDTVVAGGPPERHEDETYHWFEALADHLGPAYLRYSFTKGTEQEVAFLVEALHLEPGHRVLDVGCGPGRHAHALAARGIGVHGVDVSERFVELARRDAPPGATFERLDARNLAFDGAFDAAISLCQGGFGLLQGEDAPVLAGMARALRVGGRLATSAFSAYFQLRWLEDGDTFDASTGVNHERTILKGTGADDAEFDLWTTCFTPRELRLLAERAGLGVEDVWSVAPGAYRADPPSIDTPEFLLIARKPGVG